MEYWRNQYSANALIKVIVYSEIEIEISSTLDPVLTNKIFPIKILSCEIFAFNYEHLIMF